MSKFTFTYFFLIPILGFSQTLGFLDFSIEDIGTNVNIHWTIAAGNQCQDVEVQHSLEGEDFETIFTYAGICGDPNFDLGYDYLHTTALKNHANYYRIKINQDISQILRVFISGRENVNFITDYRTGLTKIDFIDLGGPVRLTIFEINGRMTYDKVFEDSSEPIYLPSVNGSSFIVQLKQNGIYRTNKYH